MTQRKVPVDGGALELHELTRGPGPVALALHGITANALAWVPLAAAVAGRVRLVAPDLRGRAGSSAVVGEWGIGAHADDVPAVLDDLGVERAVLVGHSMGAFVAALAAARHPDRVSGVLLVDGGLAFPPPPGTDADALLHAVLGPAMARLTMTFASPDAYLGFWADHPAVGPVLAGPDGGALRDYLLHDLVGDGEGALVSSCVLAAVRADGLGVLSDAEVHGAVRAVTAPTTVAWASRGLMNEAQGLYDEARLAALDLPARVRVLAVPDTNHYDVLFAPPAVALRARELLALALVDPVS